MEYKMFALWLKNNDLYDKFKDCYSHSISPIKLFKLFPKDVIVFAINWGDYYDYKWSEINESWQHIYCSFYNKN